MISKEESHHNTIPSWNGLEETWQDYLRDVERVHFSILEKDRALLPGKLARKLTGPAKAALKWLEARDIAKPDGLQRLLSALQTRLGDLPVPDLANKLDAFIFHLRRKPNETMNERGLRFMEVYRQLANALDRVRGKPVKILDFNGADDAIPEYKLYDGEDNDEESDEEPPAPVTPPRTSRVWQGRAAQSPSAQSACSPTTFQSSPPLSKTTRAISTGPLVDDSENSEFLPSEVRGWLLLRNAGFNIQERAALIIHTGCPEVRYHVSSSETDVPSQGRREAGREQAKEGTCELDRWGGNVG